MNRTFEACALVSFPRSKQPRSVRAFGNRDLQGAYIEGKIRHSLLETAILQFKVAQSNDDHTIVVSEERFPPVEGLYGNPV